MKNNDVHHYTTPTQVVWEEVGSEVVILDTTTNTTHHLTGTLAEAFMAAATGQPVQPKEVATLLERGFLEPRSPITRRHLVAGGAAGLGLTFTSLSLPGVAAASSTQPKPSITADSLLAGQWEWTAGGGNLTVLQSHATVLLPDLPVFVEGDRWRLTLNNLGNAEAEAVIQKMSSGLLQPLSLTFTFPLTGGLTAPAPGTTLQGTLTKISDPTVFSEQFPINPM
jgi:hypothetical protein